jgi:hypothetical protein
MIIKKNKQTTFLQFNSTFEKWDANWHKSYYKFAYDYGVEKQDP